MSEPIKIGDLVVVVRQHCEPGLLGYIFVVQDVLLNGTSRCSRCGSVVQAPKLARLEFDASDGRWWTYPESWLRRIPPLWELDETEHQEELTA